MSCCCSHDVLIMNSNNICRSLDCFSLIYRHCLVNFATINDNRDGKDDDIMKYKPFEK